MTKQSQRAAAGRPRRLALLCCASVLTLGLAACNTTGGGAGGGTGNGGAAPTAPTTELGKAQAAAKAAMDAAKTQSDAAAVEAAKAEAAQMNLVMLQTGDPMAKKHAEAARAAARAAMTAYETAKAESAKAAAATTSTAAVVARIAAQAAQKTAQAQQKIAMDKAAAAVKAAGMEVKVSYDEDGQATYRVGEVTIVAGAEKMEKTVDGKTTITGKIADILTTRRSERGAEEKGKNEMAQPKVGPVDMNLGSITDSADDSMRLYLVDKYVTSKDAGKDGTAGLFRRDPKVNGAHPVTFGQGPNSVTENAPYGTIRVGGKDYVIKRAEGPFYLGTHSSNPSTAPTKTNVKEFTISDRIDYNAKEESGIYYYDDVNGNRTWFKRVGVIADSTDTETGNVGIKFQRISAIEGIRFPAAKSFKHLNYGVWAKPNEDDDTTLADLGTGFVSTLPDGTVTPVGDMPNFGSAKYEGGWAGNIRAADPNGNGKITNRRGGMTTIAKFGDNTLTTTLDGLATLKGGIDGNGFKGTRISGVGTTGDLAGGDGYTGSFSGSFFGPKAEEIGGVFDITSEGAKAGEARGAFGGARVPDSE